MHHLTTFNHSVIKRHTVSIMSYESLDVPKGTARLCLEQRNPDANNNHCG